MKTREEWLEAAAGLLWPLLPSQPPSLPPPAGGLDGGSGKQPDSLVVLSDLGEHGTARPPIKISVGWPKGGSGRRKRLGECWSREQSDDKATAHIFVAPDVTSALEVLRVVAHELCHAWAGRDTKHKGLFIKAAKHVGFMKPWTSTPASEGLLLKLEELAKELGAYPHVGLNKLYKPKQKTRMRLYECSHGQKVRAATDELQATCEVCGTGFVKKDRPDEDEE